MTRPPEGRAGTSVVNLEQEQRSITELVDNATTQLTRLVRDEMRLARIEMREKGKGIAKGAGIAGAGGLLLFFGAAALVAAAGLALALVVPGWAAALIVAAVLFVSGGAFALLGKKTVGEATPPVPNEAIGGVRDDIDALEGRSRG